MTNQDRLESGRRRLLVAWLAAVVAALEGCGQAPPAPAVRAFGDNRHWITLEPMEYVLGSTADRIVVPQGFVTDFASIPPALAVIGLSPHGQFSRAAIVHDYLYWAQGCTRAQADRLLVIAMKESRVGRFDEFVVYRGVSAGGAGAWAKNRRERDSGLPRVVPEAYQRPADPNVGWFDYRKMLIDNEVVDPMFDPAPAYCRYGDSTDVP